MSDEHDKTLPHETMKILERENNLLHDKVQILEKKLHEFEDINERNKQLTNLIEINTFITNSLEKEEVLYRILLQVKVLVKCEKSSILLVDKDINELKFAFLCQEEDIEKLKDINLKMGEGIAGTVWQNGLPVIINNTLTDPRFTNKADKVTEMTTSSIIAVPLIVNGEIIGIMEAINKISGDFSQFDLQIMQFVSTQSAIAIKNADLYDMAISDGLTKLYIQKYFRERLFEEWQRSKRYKSHLSIVLFDIDYFKNFNDAYGHQAGDMILREVGRTLKTHCRTIDVPCRYGGEEFVVILPDTSREQAFIFADRTREMLADLRINYHEQILRLTVSGGMASIPELTPKDIDGFIDMADSALYFSKKNGRNQVNFFEGK